MIDRNNFKKILEKEVYELSELKKKVDRSLENAPSGSLHVSLKEKRTPEYYLYEGRKKRKYIAKDNVEFIEKLAQKEYDKEMLALVDKRLIYGEEMLRQYEIPLDSAFTKLSDAKKDLVQTYYLSDEEYIRKWYKAHPGGQNNYPFYSEIYTERGEQVRSKSEKILADLFLKKNVPYVYEPKFILGNNSFFIVDFLLLNIRLRRSLAFEHFGMMGNPEYADRVCEKLARYQANGYVMGENFLFTMETQNMPLNTKMVEGLIDRFLK